MQAQPVRVEKKLSFDQAASPKAAAKSQFNPFENNLERSATPEKESYMKLLKQNEIRNQVQPADINFNDPDVPLKGKQDTFQPKDTSQLRERTNPRLAEESAQQANFMKVMNFLQEQSAKPKQPETGPQELQQKLSQPLAINKKNQIK